MKSQPISPADILLLQSADGIRQIVMDCLKDYHAGNLPVPTQAENDIIDITAACALLNLKRGSIYQRVHASTIPFIKKPGFKKLMFSRKKLMEWAGMV